MIHSLSTRFVTLLAAGGLLALTAVVGCQRADSSTPAVSETIAEPTPTVKAGEYKVDPSHSEIGFRVKHLGISTVRGLFNETEAVLIFPEDKLSSLQAEATIQAGSIFTNDADRDAHLRSADFFDVENHPVISFKATDVTAVEGSQFMLNGDLTIRGITKPITLEGEFLGSEVDPWGSERAAFTAEGTINRKDFGLNWNKALEAGGLLVGEDVTIVLNLQAVKNTE